MRSRIRLPDRRQSARRSLAALLVLSLLLAVGCQAGAATLDDATLSARDVPRDWRPVDIEESQGAALWDVLPDLLTVSSDARLILRVFESESGLHGAATMLIEADDPAALPPTIQDDEALAPLSRLLARQDALLIPSPLGGDPNAYFSVSDEPLPGTVRSRLVRTLDGDALIFSDSATFTTGSVLAVVTVWYPQDEGPLLDVAELSSDVERKLRSYLGQS